MENFLHILMVSQVILSSETLVTDVTIEWSFVSVNSLLKFCKIFGLQKWTVLNILIERSFGMKIDGVNTSLSS